MAQAKVEGKVLEAASSGILYLAVFEVLAYVLEVPV